MEEQTMKQAVFSLVLFVFATSVFAQTAVPVAQEPAHHLKLENPYVRVYDVVVAPGEATLFHLHSLDYAFVIFGDATLKSQILGQQEHDLPAKNGDVNYTPGPITHRVRNTGTTVFHNLTIEFPGPKPSHTGLLNAPLGKGQSIVFENDRIRVVRLKLKPGESTGMHTHTRPSLGIAVTAGSLLVEYPDRQPEKRALTPAFFSWREAQLTHSITNTGNLDYESVDIELK
jgi:quercetin dioxygenase-like cupin family protein